MRIHIVYKVTNLINEKYYIGKHSTNNINDGYLGSGFAIKNAIKKYGKSNFKKEILYTFYDEQSALNKEKELVNEQVVNDKKSYNETLGGYGSFYHCFNNKEILKKAIETRIRRGWKQTEKSKKMISNSVKALHLKHSDIFKEKLKERMAGQNNPMFGKTHSDETKRKIALTSIGRKLNIETRKKISLANKGRVVSDETKRKISNSKIGTKESLETRLKKSESHKNKTLSFETRKKISLANKGRVVSDETKRKMSVIGKTKIGKLNGNYKKLDDKCINLIKYNINKSPYFVFCLIKKEGYKYTYGKIRREMDILRNNENV